MGLDYIVHHQKSTQQHTKWAISFLSCLCNCRLILAEEFFRRCGITARPSTPILSDVYPPIGSFSFSEKHFQIFIEVIFHIPFHQTHVILTKRQKFTEHSSLSLPLHNKSIPKVNFVSPRIASTSVVEISQADAYFARWLSLSCKNPVSAPFLTAQSKPGSIGVTKESKPYFWVNPATIKTHEKNCNFPGQLRNRIVWTPRWPDSHNLLPNPRQVRFVSAKTARSPPHDLPSLNGMLMGTHRTHTFV